MSTPAAAKLRKRLKVVSACGECRRKKTKCSGLKPCAGCEKANVVCKYIELPKARAVPTSIAMAQDIAPRSSLSSSSSSIDEIENRLSVIEDILRALVPPTTHGGSALAATVAAPNSESPTTHSSTFGAAERDQLAHFRERFHPRPSLHAAHYQNRHMARQQVDDDDGRCIIRTRFHPYNPQSSTSTPTRLPPLLQRPHHPPLSASSSTSSTSSSVSSPKLSAIRSLLNNDDDPIPTAAFCSTQTSSPIPTTSAVPSFHRPS